MPSRSCRVVSVTRRPANEMKLERRETKYSLSQQHQQQLKTSTEDGVREREEHQQNHFLLLLACQKKKFFTHFISSYSLLIFPSHRTINPIHVDTHE